MTGYTRWRVDSQKAGSMQHLHQARNDIKLFFRNIQPDIEYFDQLGPNLFPRIRVDICEWFENSLDLMNIATNSI